MSWLDDLAAAEARGATGTAGINKCYLRECDCSTCTYHQAKHDLMEAK
jgi:hypothetical protein